jgi:hypothetical protein
MVNAWRVLKLSARAAVWRTTAGPPLVGLPILLGFAVLVAAARIALQLLASDSWHDFNPYGLNATVAWIALELAVAALFVRPAVRASALSALFVLSIFADLVTAALQFGTPFLVPLLRPAIAQNDMLTSEIAANVFFAIGVIWWIGAMSAVVASLEPKLSLRLIGRVAALGVALLIADALVPHAPVFLPPHFDARNANWWEVLYALHQGHGGEAEAAPAALAKLEKAQAAILKQQLSALAPPRPGVTGVYALGIAGWANQDVFIKELDGGLAVLAGVLPIKDRTVRLINNRTTLETIPLADPQNFKAAVHGIAQVMNKDTDILVLVMTSHGSESGGFMLQVPGKTVELTGPQVAAALDGEGIKNRVVIVSACFSGSFVPPLANDNTIVMTAADAKSASFGCAPERDWTYFGDAFFQQSLHPGSDFKNSFDHARILIQGWELMDHAPPSNPQGHFGPALVAKLAPLFAAATGQ